MPLWSSSMALQKGSPLTTFLKAAIGEVTEKGQIQKIITKFHGPVYEHFCQPIGGTSSRSASLNTLMLLFIIVLSGIILAVVILLLEIISIFYGELMKRSKSNGVPFFSKNKS